MSISSRKSQVASRKSQVASRKSQVAICADSSNAVLCFSFCCGGVDLMVGRQA